MDTIAQRILDLYERYRGRYINQIQNIFNEYFGEEFVDLQDIEDCTDENFDLDSFKNFFKYLLNIRHYPYHYIPTTIKEINTLKNFLINIRFREESLNRDEESLFEELDHHLFPHKSGYAIVVRFPEVKVENEYKQFTIIKNLFVQVHITFKGGTHFSRDSLLGLCSTYSAVHFYNGYTHSHLPTLDKSNVNRFREFCKGVGPINRTCEVLLSGFDEDQWRQFCWDLDKYVTIESESGGPYKHLNQCNTIYYSNENLTRVSNIDYISSWKWRTYFGNSYSDCSDCTDFIKYLLENKVINFAWNPTNGWCIGENVNDYIIIISNAFFKYLSTKLEELNITKEKLIDFIENSGFFRKVVVTTSGVYPIREVDTDFSEYVGKYCCTFKGIDYNLEIENIEDVRQNSHLILNITYINYISNLILKTLNTHYGRS